MIIKEVVSAILNSMERSTPRAVSVPSGTREIFRILYKKKVYSHVQEFPLLGRRLSHINSIHMHLSF